MKINAIDVPFFTDSHLFSPAANTYKEHGYYTDAFPGTKEYYEYWDRETERSLYGYTAPNGITITGFHYFYLNYCPIQLTRDEELPDGSTITHRENNFPRFYDGDYKYFHAVDIARKTNKHLSVLKARRKGYSYKAASMLNRNYFLVSRSKNFVFASSKDYLTGDGILSKVWEQMAFIDDNTAWTQPRIINKEMEKKSGFKEMVNGTLIDKGKLSSIIGVTLKDNPHKIRGKAGELMFFEEAGSFKGLLQAWEIAMPTMRQGSKTLGTMIAFGTGGEEGEGFDSLEELFYHPSAYDCFEVDNVWDPGAIGTHCGYFVPIEENLEGFVDDNGNSDRESAILFEEAQREKKKLAGDVSSLDQYIAEHPRTPQEATLQTTINMFPLVELKEQYNRVMVNNLHIKEAVTGKMYQSKDGPKFRLSPEAKQITNFPHRKGDDTTGATVIYEEPYRTKEGLIPINMYFVCHDPYAHDDSTAGSLGAAYVIKRPNAFSKPDDIIVASYVGRPQTQDEYNAQLFLLAEYYNAKIGFENDRGEVIPFAKRYRQLHMLQEEFEMLDKKELQSKKVRRNYGMHMTPERKKQGEIYIRDWLKSKRGKTEDGEYLLNLHYIYDLGLLQELLKFNHDGNFDRVMALMIGMYHTRELYNKQVVENINDRSQDDWFDSLFS